MLDMDSITSGGQVMETVDRLELKIAGGVTITAFRVPGEPWEVKVIYPDGTTDTANKSQQSMARLVGIMLDPMTYRGGQ